VSELKLDNIHGKRLDFGKHKGELWTRVPISYLKWLASTDNRWTKIAVLELKRRGTTTPTIEVSGHAIDRASQHCLSIWQGEETGEGLSSWLRRLAQEAIDNGEKYREDAYLYRGMKFCFELEGNWPILKTVMRAKQND
jgi:uncharacterized protein (DUF3820 family)